MIRLLPRCLRIQKNSSTPGSPRRSLTAVRIVTNGGRLSGFPPFSSTVFQSCQSIPQNTKGVRYRFGHEHEHRSAEHEHGEIPRSREEKFLAANGSTNACHAASPPLFRSCLLSVLPDSLGTTFAFGRRVGVLRLAGEVEDRRCLPPPDRFLAWQSLP